MQVGTVFAAIIGTGVITVPPGTRAFTINALSGIGYINTVEVRAGTIWSYNSADSKCLTASGINVGATGVNNNISVFYAG